MSASHAAVNVRHVPAYRWAGVGARLGAALLVLALPGVSSAEVPARSPEVQARRQE